MAKGYLMLLIFFFAVITVNASNFSSTVINWKASLHSRYEKFMKPGPSYYMREIDALKSMRTTYVWGQRAVPQFWIDMDRYKDDFTVQSFYLTGTEESIELPFDFNFFGHKIRTLLLTNYAGIMSESSELEWYISPLMIDTGRPCFIKILSNEKMWTFQWEAHPLDPEEWDRELSIQVNLHPEGRVDFVYKKIPFGSLNSFRQNYDHMRTLFGVGYDYELPDDTFTLGSYLYITEKDVSEGTVILFDPVALCSNYKTCDSCTGASVLATDSNATLPCIWCPVIQSCSTKEDFLRNSWQKNSCDRQQISDKRHCPGPKQTNEIEIGYKGPVEEKESNSWLVDVSWLIISVCVIVSAIFLMVCAYCTLECMFRGKSEQNKRRQNPPEIDHVRVAIGA